MWLLIHAGIEVNPCWSLYFDSVHEARLYQILRQIKNSRHFADDILRYIFLNENVGISIEILLNLAPKGPLNNKRSVFQIILNSYMDHW